MHKSRVEVIPLVVGNSLSAHFKTTDKLAPHQDDRVNLPKHLTKAQYFLLYSYKVPLKQWHTLPIGSSFILTRYQNK